MRSMKLLVLIKNGSSSSWDAGYSDFPTNGYAVFLRGSHASYGRSAGVFAFGSDIGKADTIYSFRPVVLSSQP